MVAIASRSVDTSRGLSASRGRGHNIIVYDNKLTKFRRRRCMWYVRGWVVGLQTRGSKNEMLNVLSGSRNAFRTVENVFTSPATHRSPHHHRTGICKYLCAYLHSFTSHAHTTSYFTTAPPPPVFRPQSGS